MMRKGSVTEDMSTQAARARYEYTSSAGKIGVHKQRGQEERRRIQFHNQTKWEVSVQSHLRERRTPEKIGYEREKE